MESLTTGTIAGAGAFRCEQCGFVVTTSAVDELPPCPRCSGDAFARASLFSTGRLPVIPDDEAAAGAQALISHARAAAEAVGPHLAWEEGGDIRVVPVRADKATSLGRSLSADVRFDDATVSRRHALVVREGVTARVLDDRSLNGVFVNGERVEWRALCDGDEIVVGRYRLHFVEVPAGAAGTGPASATPTLEAEA